MQGYGKWKQNQSQNTTNTKKKAETSTNNNTRRRSAGGGGYTSYASRKYQHSNNRKTTTSTSSNDSAANPKPEDDFYGVDDLFRDLSHEWEKEQELKRKTSQNNNTNFTSKEKKWYEDLLEFLEESAGISYQGDSNSTASDTATTSGKNASNGYGQSQYTRPPQQDLNMRKNKNSNNNINAKRQPGSNNRRSKSMNYEAMSEKKRQKDVDDMLEQLKKEMGID